MLNTTSDYTEGDNKPVIPTDTIKNTVYYLAKKHGVSSYSHTQYHLSFSLSLTPPRLIQVKTIEGFALLLSEHFLSFYSHVGVDVLSGCKGSFSYDHQVIKTIIEIEQAAWHRIVVVRTRASHGARIVSHACRTARSTAMRLCRARRLARDSARSRKTSMVSGVSRMCAYIQVMHSYQRRPS